MTATVIIPARYGSTRFPAKILASQTGRPLVQHVVDQARKAKRVKDVIVATDDQRIVDALSPFGTRCVMTSPGHQSGTDRIAEAAADVGDDVIVNVQGDEPEIEPGVIDGLIDRMSASDDVMATCATAFKSTDDVKNLNLVKVVRALSGHAVYFSRSVIPFDRDASFSSDGSAAIAAAYWLHLGIYAYRRSFLMEFASWEPTPLEKSEKLEQLRAIEHGCRIYVLPVERATHGIDTVEQYNDFVKEFVKRSGA